ncbi:MAG: hypothetical protein NTY07_20010 [Bacteroidia bacterium]|nr:hypothetical protein [Bacteroidia bacterium]
MNQDSSQMVWQEYQTIEDANKLLADMQCSRYKFMNISGIVKSTRLDENEVAVILNVLKSKNIIEEVVMNSHAYFKLTERGLSLRFVTNRLLQTEEPMIKDIL